MAALEPGQVDDDIRPVAVDLASNTPLRVAMQVARSWGVSPSEFLGDARRTVTTHEYDDTGRLVRTTTEVDGWTDDDRELAFALADYEADLCDGCGQPLAETTATENSDAYVLDADLPYLRCHYCTALEQQGSALQTKHTQPGALRLRLRLDAGRVARNRAFIDGQDDGGTGHPTGP